MAALGPIGDKTVLIRGEHFAETYSVSCICSFADEPTFIEARTDSNTQFDFMGFVARAIQDGYLKSGDILVCDNASVHGGQETLEAFLTYLELRGVTLKYLPPYSPEFNPCELIFAQVKRYPSRLS